MKSKTQGFEPQDIIRQAIKRHRGHIAVACSFGKDSMRVLRWALDEDPEIIVIFENTGVEFKETIHFAKRMQKEWNLNLHETTPLKSFWQCVGEYGLPEKRKSGGEGSNAPECCKYLKEKPAMMLQQDLGVNAVITGMQACENNNRALIAMRYDNKKAPYMEKDDIEFCSQRWFTRSTQTWMFHPIMLWSTERVWQSTIEDKIPINEVYTKWDGLYPRCGCLPCTAYSSWHERLSVSHPRLYEHLTNIGGIENVRFSGL